MSATGAMAALSPVRSSARVFAEQDQRALPLPATGELTPGQHPLNLGENPSHDGLLYVPRGYKPGVATPLMVVLHGAGGSSRSTSYTFPLADEFGVIILAPDSADWTWDAILGVFGPDVAFIQTVINRTAERCTFDRARVALAGHSDGASYALSLGISAGELFRHIIAFSPGVCTPSTERGTPRIFISHGTEDQTMPINDTSRKIVRQLKSRGYEVTYREFKGRHNVPAPIAREAFEWFMR